MILKKAEKDDLPNIVEFVVSMNRVPETKCAYIGTDQEEVLNYLEEIYEENKTRFFWVESDNQFVGAIVGDICEDNHSVEVIGPFVSCKLENRYECACNLIESVMGDLPDYRYSFYIDCANAFVAEIVLSMRGKKQGNYYFMSLELTQNERKDAQLTKKSILYQNSDFEEKCVKSQIEDLHNTLFPTAYYNGRTILELTDNQHMIFYCMEEDKVVSYACFNIEEGAYLDFIGTDPNYRNQGYATILLECVTEFLKRKDYTKVELCVDDKHKEAIHLYHLLGFRVEEYNQSFVIDGNNS